MSEYKCSKCSKLLDEIEAYEYRGVYSCEEHFDSVIQARDFQRKEIINEEHAKTKAFKGLDMTDSIIGKANNKLLRRRKEVASKESGRLKIYEGRYE